MSATDTKSELEPIWVKPGSSVQGLGGMIANAIHEHGEVVLRAIGAGAVNQAVKGTVRARQVLIGNDYDLVVRPAMRSETGRDGGPVAVMVLRCTLA